MISMLFGGHALIGPIIFVLVERQKQETTSSFWKTSTDHGQWTVDKQSFFIFYVFPIPRSTPNFNLIT